MAREAISKDATIRVQLAERRGVARVLLQRLTPRERQVMDLVVTGLKNKQIAGHLKTSEKTVKVHRGRLLEKMQVKSATALAGLLAHAGMGPPTEPNTAAH